MQLDVAGLAIVVQPYERRHGGREDRGNGRAGDAHVQAVDEDRVQDYVRQGEDHHHNGRHPGGPLAPDESRHCAVQDEDGGTDHYPDHVVIGDAGHITGSHSDKNVAAEEHKDGCENKPEHKGEQEGLGGPLGGLPPGAGANVPGDHGCASDAEPGAQAGYDLVQGCADGGGGEGVGAQARAPGPVRQGVDLDDQERYQKGDSHRPDGLPGVAQQHGHVPFRRHASSIDVLRVIASEGSYS